MNDELDSTDDELERQRAITVLATLMDLYEEGRTIEAALYRAEHTATGRTATLDEEGQPGG